MIVGRLLLNEFKLSCCKSNVQPICRQNSNAKPKGSFACVGVKSADIREHGYIYYVISNISSTLVSCVIHYSFGILLYFPCVF